MDIPDMRRHLQSLISLSRLQFGYNVDEVSFILGYYSAQGSRSTIINVLKAHSTTNEELRDITEIISKNYEEDLHELRKVIYELCEEKGLNIPKWLREYFGGEVHDRGNEEG